MEPSRIRAWMEAHVSEATDPQTGEVNCTQLGEMACRELDGYEGDEIPEVFWEEAFEVDRENGQDGQNGR